MVYLNNQVDKQKAKYFDLKTKEWLDAPDLNHTRKNFHCCSMTERLYVYGGRAPGKFAQVNFIVEWINVNELLQSSSTAMWS